MLVTSSGPSNITGVVGWVNDPNGRGTSGLAVSCIITLSMCVWSALHLNIPSKGEPRSKYWLRNVRWVMLGIFAPELVVLAAWRQWTCAKSLTIALAKLSEDQEAGAAMTRVASTLSKGANTSEDDWSKVHSHFAGMGGLAIDQPADAPEVDTYLPANVKRLTLTAHGVLLLARCGYLPRLTIQDIDDKSKTDALAKFIVVLQAGWMLSSTVGRLIAGLPISLLEVNTIGHVLCAFAIYVLWWSKPREVYEPVVLSGGSMDKICAYMYMSSRISALHPGFFSLLRSRRRPELSRLIYLPPSADDSEGLGTFINMPARADTFPIQGNTRWLSKGHGHAVELEKSASVATTRIGGLPSSDKPTPPERDVLINHSNSHGHRSGMQARRHRLALEAIKEFPAIRERFQPPSANSPAPHPAALHPTIKQLVVRTSSNWPTDSQMCKLKGQTLGMALWFASMGYGGVHMAAWNEYFPTPAERTMWHFSAVYVTCSGAFWFALNILAFCWPWAQRWFERVLDMRLHWAHLGLLYLGAAVCGLAYVFARFFLVVEAIISLRSVPATVYATPNWTTAVPHL